jgi:hypothetical protein
MGEHASQMLTDFMNTRPEIAAFERFKKKWERHKRGKNDYEFRWTGSYQDFVAVQELVGQVWEGKKRGYESLQLNVSLGLGESTEEHQLAPPPIRAHWLSSSLYISPRDLRDLVWLTLLEHSQRLGICENKKSGECPAPYFLKYRPSARFCSEPCALTTQRESKRRWWKEHGQDWLNKRALRSKSQIKGKKA